MPVMKTEAKRAATSYERIVVPTRRKNDVRARKV
jgi:hypothetical protein